MKVGDKVFFPTVNTTEDYPGCLTKNCFAIRNAVRKGNLYLTIFVVDERQGLAIVGTDTPDSTFKISDLKLYKEMKKYTIEEIVNQKIAVVCTDPEQANALNTEYNSSYAKFRSEFKVGMGNEKFEVMFSDFHIQWNPLYKDKPSYFLQMNYANFSINFNQVKFNSNKKPIGYELIKTYPGSKGLGYCEKYTTGELSNYPEFWKPIYEEEKIKVQLNNKFLVTVTKKHIFVTGANENNLPISPKFLEELLEDMENNIFHEFGLEYKITFPSVKIGCSTFTLEEIKQVYNTWKKLQ